MMQAVKTSVLRPYMGFPRRYEKLACGHRIYADVRPARRRRCYLCEFFILHTGQRLLMMVFDTLRDITQNPSAASLVHNRNLGLGHTTSCGVDIFGSPAKLANVRKPHGL